MAAPPETISLRPRILPPEASLRPTRAEVDLGAIAHNLRVLRQIAGSARVLAVVKADAYGHGVVPVTARLQAEGVDGFGVALAEEGIELRDAGITAEILVLNGVYGGAHADVLHHGLTPVVYDLGEVEAFERAAGGRPFAVHLKVDTGMARLGVPVDELPAFLDRLSRHRRVRIEGLMTHLASADADDEFTREQLARFARAEALLVERGHRPRVVHAANSAGAFRHAAARFDLIRPGLALFGYRPADDVRADLRPALRLRTEIIAIRELPSGAPVGYNARFRTTRRTRIATLPVGYGDGLFRAATNRGEVLVRGQRAPMVGAVSMDLTTIDVTDVPDVALHDEAILLGTQDGQVLGADDLARASGTIPYEVLTNISRRVPRFYRS